MPAVAKRTKTWKEKLPPGKSYPIDDALKLVKEFATAKFNESVDVSVNLGVDATKSDQQVRGSTVMPHGTGKTVRVAVFGVALPFGMPSALAISTEAGGVFMMKVKLRSLYTVITTGVGNPFSKD